MPMLFNAKKCLKLEMYCSIGWCVFVGFFFGFLLFGLGFFGGSWVVFVLLCFFFKYMDSSRCG